MVHIHNEWIIIHSSTKCKVIALHQLLIKFEASNPNHSSVSTQRSLTSSKSILPICVSPKLIAYSSKSCCHCSLPLTSRGIFHELQIRPSWHLLQFVNRGDLCKHCCMSKVEAFSEFSRTHKMRGIPPVSTHPTMAACSDSPHARIMQLKL